ncbi:MAG: DEAD/DEAH box helicase family protein [Lachnospiraceae bacterium]|nr:DEAD/DEAH box helicase family protein [Lachnospiraceae bacterium]
MRNDLAHYTADYISGVMSLRKPQKESLKILENIVNSVPVCKGMDLKTALDKVHAMYPVCSDFERTFPSLTFALATGVGKTRLMGAFIAYLYTQHGIKNFFVVAPGTTIYDKLKCDFSDQSGEKYVFRGLGCFATPPRIITDNDYKEKTLSLFESDVHIFIYNIGKFDKEAANMKKVNELMGDSFYRYLSNLPDLVLLMDESHHYRAEKGMQALNDLNPMLGLELTATPMVTKGSKQTPFKNVVYEYPLSAAIADGYTRTPYAVTRSDIDFYNFGEEQLDKMMLLDGITCHENVKRKLRQYALNQSTPENPIPVIKPFMLVVCKDTTHAAWVQNFICSDEFRNGAYCNKTILVHSKQKGAESDANTRLLLSVERPDNPVEIVIHVNMLKEGWDVNNLYTIVPLRTAASKILREQMVGRGLRLPYGKRTGDSDVDAVMLTAHDKFADIIAEAQRGDSIFKAGNVIQVEELEHEQISYAQMTLDLEPDSMLDDAYARTNLQKSDQRDDLFRKAGELIDLEVMRHIQTSYERRMTPPQTQKIVETVSQKIAGDKDLGEVFRENEDPLTAWIQYQTEETHRVAQAKFIPIPQIKITDAGVEEYRFVDFDLDLSEFTHVPIKNELIIQNLEDMQDRKHIRGDSIDFEGYHPERVILGEIRKKPEIDYEKCSELLFKLISQVCSHYECQYGLNGMQNIVMMYKRDIGGKIYNQMMRHFYCENGFLVEEVIGTRNYNLQQTYSWVEKADLYGNFYHKIQSVLFTGIKKGVFSTAKFDSEEGELTLARVLESDKDVLNWIRPAPQEFNITYNNGKHYRPDFVVETEDTIYLVEVKAEKALTDPDVIAKKGRALKYCEVATSWGLANGYKPWRYLFIPAKQILPSSSFTQLARRFGE